MNVAVAMSNGGVVKPNLSAVRFPNFKQEVYRKDGESVIYDWISRTQYAYPAVNSCRWTVLTDSKTINGYLCKKAEGIYKNRKYIAWFAPEIPISEGPYNFKGLPGLIISVEDAKGFYKFNLVELKRKETPIIVPENVLNTSFEKFKKKRDEVLADPVGEMMAAYNHTVPKEYEEQIRKNRRENNNFLD